MSVPQLYLKFKGLLAFFEEQETKLGISLYVDIQELTPHYFKAIKKHIDEAETEYRANNAHGVDEKIIMVKRLFFTAAKEIDKKKKGKK